MQEIERIDEICSAVTPACNSIFAVFSAASVDSLWIEKKYKEADIASKNAERYCTITFITGLVVWMIYLSI